MRYAIFDKEGEVLGYVDAGNDHEAIAEARAVHPTVDRVEEVEIEHMDPHGRN